MEQVTKKEVKFYVLLSFCVVLVGILSFGWLSSKTKRVYWTELDGAGVSIGKNRKITNHPFVSWNNDVKPDLMTSKMKKSFSSSSFVSYKSERTSHSHISSYIPNLHCFAPRGESVGCPSSVSSLSRRCMCNNTSSSNGFGEKEIPSVSYFNRVSNKGEMEFFQANTETHFFLFEIRKSFTHTRRDDFFSDADCRDWRCVEASDRQGSSSPFGVFPEDPGFPSQGGQSAPITGGVGMQLVIVAFFVLLRYRKNR